MPSRIKLALALVVLTLAFGAKPSASAQESAKSSNGAKTLATGTFHGKVHKTSGRATVYQEGDGKLLLRLKNNTERIELGKLKGNEGDQNYDIPAGTDLNKFQTVSIYCERFDANFGAAPLEKF